MGRGDLSDEQWSVLESLLPAAGVGRRSRNRRRLINGVRWRVRTSIRIAGAAFVFLASSDAAAGGYRSLRSSSATWARKAGSLAAERSSTNASTVPSSSI
ncbi:transposase [Streptomyces sp. NPDC058279]|uniref:transposase n=1 Tax=Streptomyces sp. NPDC058279 TaxID=3346418 RepID=UPI0036EFC956